jgi:hypothetical protein
MIATLVSPRHACAFDKAWENLPAALTLDDAAKFIRRWASSQRRAKQMGLLLIDRLPTSDAWTLLYRLGDDAPALIERFGELRLA